MKAGIMTCHDVFNYGSSLQAYALSQRLTIAGIDVQIIDYKPDYLYRLIDLMQVDSPAWQKSFLRRWAYRVRVLPYKLSLLPKYFRYRAFNKKWLPITRKRYHSYEQLKTCREFDVLICGSDQVWSSVKNACGEDPAFYLAFSDHSRKVAYAASFGADTVSPKGECCVRTYLPAFAAVGVREHSGVLLLQRLGITAQQVLDPVFLLDREQWYAMARKPKHIPEQYVLTYGYDSSADMKTVTQNYAAQLNMPVISLRADGPYGQMGPREFLSMIKDARLVVTSSFHAVVFCLLFHTPFVAVQTGNIQLFERIADILCKFGMQDRIWKKDKPVDITAPIDFSYVEEQLAKDRAASEAFLLEALHDSENI